MSKLALTHQVNTNMVFKWRRQLREGLFDTAPQVSAALLPVLVAAPVARRTAKASTPTKIVVPDGMIEIAIADALVRVRGDVDAALLKTVIRSLRA